MALVIIFFAGFAAVGAIQDQQARQPDLLAQTQQMNVTYLSWYYGGAFPTVGQRGHAGSENAATIIIAFLAPLDDASRQFMRDTYPSLRDGAIANGTLRFYGRTPVSRADVRDRNERFLYALALSCVNSIDPSAYGRVYEDIIGTPVSQLAGVVTDAGIPRAAYDECMRTGAVASEDVALTEKDMAYTGQRLYIGFGGTMMTVFDGIPPATTLSRTLRSYAINIGE